MSGRVKVIGVKHARLSVGRDAAIDTEMKREPHNTAEDCLNLRNDGFDY